MLSEVNILGNVHTTLVEVTDTMTVTLKCQGKFQKSKDRVMILMTAIVMIAIRVQRKPWCIITLYILSLMMSCVDRISLEDVVRFLSCLIIKTLIERHGYIFKVDTRFDGNLMLTGIFNEHFPNANKRSINKIPVQASGYKLITVQRSSNMVVQSKFAIRRQRSYCMPFVVEHNIAGILGFITINFHDSFILCNSITPLQGEID